MIVAQSSVQGKWLQCLSMYWFVCIAIDQLCRSMQIQKWTAITVHIVMSIIAGSDHIAEKISLLVDCVFFGQHLHRQRRLVFPGWEKQHVYSYASGYTATHEGTSDISMIFSSFQIHSASFSHDLSNSLLKNKCLTTASRVPEHCWYETYHYCLMETRDVTKQKRSQAWRRSLL